MTGTSLAMAGETEFRLMVGPAGVAIRKGEEQGPTVRFDAIAAMLAFPDGGRTLVGLDGTTIPVEPTLLPAEETPRLAGYLDSRVHPDLRVGMPVRPPDEIPAVGAEEEDDGEYCCDDDCCANTCNDGQCCNDVYHCEGECCAQCCDDDCCPRDCCDYECCSDDKCAGKCCRGLRGMIGRRRRR